MIIRGKDGRYSDYSIGEMGRVCVADGGSIGEVKDRLDHLMKLQKAEAYQHYEAMAHRSLEQHPPGA